MRQAFKKRDGERFTLKATVKRYGGKLTEISRLGVYSWQETILLVDVIDASTGEYLTDHVWFKVGLTFERLMAQTGDTIQFDARIDSYVKRSGIDYHLERPTKIKVLSSNTTLFSEETARHPGTGIEYAKKLKQQYQKERMESESSEYWFQETKAVLKSSEMDAEIKRNQDRSAAIAKLRDAAKKGLIQLEPKLLAKKGFKRVSDSELNKMLSQVPQLVNA